MVNLSGRKPCSKIVSKREALSFPCPASLRGNLIANKIGQIHNNLHELPISRSALPQDRKRFLKTRKTVTRFDRTFQLPVNAERDAFLVSIGQGVVDPLFQKEKTVLLPKRRKEALQRLTSHAALAISKKAQLRESRLSRQRGLLVAIVGKPVIQEISDPFSLHRVQSINPAQPVRFRRGHFVLPGASVNTAAPRRKARLGLPEIPNPSQPVWSEIPRTGPENQCADRSRRTATVGARAIVESGIFRLTFCNFFTSRKDDPLHRA
jgi:hypothetical protein